MGTPVAALLAGCPTENVVAIENATEGSGKEEAEQDEKVKVKESGGYVRRFHNSPVTLILLDRCWLLKWFAWMGSRRRTNRLLFAERDQGTVSLMHAGEIALVQFPFAEMSTAKLRSVPLFK